MEINQINNELKEILIRLARLQADVNYLKSHVKNEDIFLTAEEEKLHEESYANEKNGKVSEAMMCAIMSEEALAENWLSKEDEEAFAYLQKR